MASSNQGGGPDGGNPTRHSGHSFALKDPERRREVTAQEQPPPMRAQPEPMSRRRERPEPAVAAGSDPKQARRPDRDR